MSQRLMKEFREASQSKVRRVQCGSSAAPCPRPLASRAAAAGARLTQPRVLPTPCACARQDKDIKLTVQDNLYKWTAYLQGPEGTPFEGGCFQVLLDVQVPACCAPPAPATRCDGERRARTKTPGPVL